MVPGDLQAAPRVGITRTFLTQEETDWVIQAVSPYLDPATGRVASGAWPKVHEAFCRHFRSEKSLDGIKKPYYAAVKAKTGGGKATGRKRASPVRVAWHDVLHGPNRLEQTAWVACRRRRR